MLDDDVDTSAVSSGEPAEAPVQAPSPPQPPSESSPGGEVSSPSLHLSLRDASKQYGYTSFPEGVDDHAALQHLILQARRAEEASRLAQVGQEVLPYYDRFRTWMQEQEAAKKPQPQSWWKAPEWDPAWESRIVRDEATGQLKPREGAPPDVVQKYLAALEHQRTFLQRFSQDPIQAIRPGIEEVVREIAQGLVQENLGGYQTQAFAQAFEREHAGWLYQLDSQGHPVTDNRGQPVPSQWGQAFYRYVQEATQIGIQGPQDRARYAYNQVRLDAALLRLQQSGAVEQGSEKKDQLLNGAGRKGNANALNQLAGGAATAPAQNDKLPLIERLRQAAKANGITDDTILASLQPE